MDCENYWPSQRARDPRRFTTGARIIRCRQKLAQAHWILWILFIGLQIADVVTTNYALAVPGNWEANPIMQLSQTHLGSAWWLPKVAAVGLAAFAVPQMLRPWPIVFAVSYYIMIVSVNIACL
jgi:Domain of unknown function (DUF5658)